MFLCVFSLIRYALNRRLKTHLCTDYRCCWRFVEPTSVDYGPSHNFGLNLHKKCVIALNVAFLFLGKCILNKILIKRLKKMEIFKIKHSHRSYKVKICVYLDSLMWFSTKQKINWCFFS